MPKRKFRDHKKFDIRKRSSGVGPTAVRSIVKSMAETKVFDIELTGQLITSTGTLFELSNIITGSMVSQRLANRIHVKSVNINYSLIGGDTTNAIRICLVNDRKPRGTTNPVISDVFEDVVANTQLSHLKWNRRFTYLMNNLHSTSVAGPDGIVVQRNIKVNKLMAFNSSTTGDYSKNSIWLAVISDSGAALHPTISFNFRIKYSEI